MSKNFKIDILTIDQQRDVIDFAKEHSLRETSKYILDTYDLELSYVSVKSIIERFSGFISDAEIRLKNRVILEAEEVISRFNELYLESPKGGKLWIIEKEANFLKDLIKNLPEIGSPEAKTVTETNLKWQKDAEKLQKSQIIEGEIVESDENLTKSDENLK